jgi:enoyl-CoA hydratase
VTSATDGAFQRLLDERAIEQLLFEYCRCADANDPDGLARCFTDDCVARYGPGPPSIGASARREQAARDLALFSATSHHLSNIEIEHLDDVRARVTSAVYAWHRPVNSAGAWQLHARYEDVVAKTPAGWRIAERTLLMIGADGFPSERAWLQLDRAASGATATDASPEANEGLPDGRTVRCEQHGPVLCMCIHRLSVRNAYNREVAELVSEALDRLETDEQLHVGILHGAGGVFSSGMDLKAFVNGELPSVGEHGLLGLVRRDRTKPLIAAVDGYAIAAGFEVALACDIIVAARDARFSLPEVTRGLVPAGGALRNLPSRVPLAVATEMALTGRELSAERAAELGLVVRLAEPNQSLQASLELATEIAANEPHAVRATKAILDRQRDWNADEFWARQHEIVSPIQSSDTPIEGATAFLEKRPPRWRDAPHGD